MVSFQTNQMLDRVILRVVGEEENTRNVIEPDIVLLTPYDVAEAKRDRWFDRDIIIRNSVCLADVDVVVINAANGQAQCILKAARLGGIATLGGGLDVRSGRFVRRAYFDRGSGLRRLGNLIIRRGIGF